MKKLSRLRVVLFATAALTAIAGTGVGASTEASAATTRDIKVLTHNIAGGMLNNGSARALVTVEAHMKTFAPDVIFMQEICASQVKAFKAAHPSYHVRFTVMMPQNPRCGGNPATTDWRKKDTRQGQVIASPHPLDVTLVKDLPGAYTESGTNWGIHRKREFRLTCAAVLKPGWGTKVEACGTHIIAGNEPMKGQQVSGIAAALKSRASTAGRAVLLGGDFNMSPGNSRMDPLNSVSRTGGAGAGLFAEADQTDKRFFGNRVGNTSCSATACRSGENTFGSTKLDHLFVSKKVLKAQGLSGGVFSKGYSDHHLYRAAFTVAF